MVEKRTKSNSEVQREAQAEMLSWLSAHIGRPLSSDVRLDVGRCTVEVDGFCDEGSQMILVEAWAHIGKAKSAQKQKVQSDILKLIHVRDCLGATSQVDCIYVFADAEAAKVLSTDCWAGIAAQQHGIQTKVAEISPQTRAAILLAQRDQDIRRR